MDNTINRLLDKIEILEKENQILRNKNFSEFMQSIDMNTWTYRGVKLTELFEYYISNKAKNGEL